MQRSLLLLLIVLSLLQVVSAATPTATSPARATCITASASSTVRSNPALKTQIAKQLSKKHKRGFLRRLFHEVSHGRIRVLLIATSGVMVALELFEEVCKEVPYLERLVGHKHATVHHGVFLLTLSHMMTTISELFEKIEEGEEMNKDISHEEAIHHLAHETFSSDKAAAIAYDKAAIAKFGRGAQTNFPFAIYKNKIFMEDGRLPVRKSDYRGVVWSNAKKAWTVPLAAFGLEDE